MEPKIAGISKKIREIVEVAIFMIKKGLSKRKIIMDLNMMMKRGKIAGKALKNLMFHHHHHHNIHHFFASQGGFGGGGPSTLPNDAPKEYEFSCSSTPLYRHYFTNKRKNPKNNNTTKYCYMPSGLPYTLENGQSVDLEEVNNVLEMILRNEEGTSGGGSTPSTPLPGLGFGQSPAVRQLRITDSPFPVQNSEDDKHVDEAAEDFINKFYSQLKQQN